jgi:hypothetical protein
MTTMEVSRQKDPRFLLWTLTGIVSIVATSLTRGVFFWMYNLMFRESGNIRCGLARVKDKYALCMDLNIDNELLFVSFLGVLTIFIWLPVMYKYLGGVVTKK